MKAERDDAPVHLRTKTEGPWRMIAILGVGSAITWGLIALFAKPIVIDVYQLKQAIRVGGQPLFSELPAQPAAQAYSEPAAPIRLPSIPLEHVQRQVTQQPSKADIEWFERMEAIAIKRSQNSFNDDNYKPKQPENTYNPPAIAVAPVVSERKQRNVSRERTSKWIKSWNGGSNYLAEWVAVNNYIDSSSVCANHRKGSIDYRECRKAAKQYYHEECRTWRARYDNDRKDHSDRMKQRYCSAASSFSPMG